MSAEIVNHAHPLEPAGKRRKPLSWCQLFLIMYAGSFDYPFLNEWRTGEKQR